MFQLSRAMPYFSIVFFNISPGRLSFSTVVNGSESLRGFIEKGNWPEGRINFVGQPDLQSPDERPHNNWTTRVCEISLHFQELFIIVKMFVYELVLNRKSLKTNIKHHRSIEYLQKLPFALMNYIFLKFWQEKRSFSKHKWNWNILRSLTERFSILTLLLLMKCKMCW